MADNLPERISVSVTQSHINAGLKGSGCGCPVALAVAELFPLHDGGLEVGNEGIFFENKGERAMAARWWRVFDMPQEARAFIESFDDGLPVAPFTFEAVRL